MLFQIIIFFFVSIENKVYNIWHCNNIHVCATSRKFSMALWSCVSTQKPGFLQKAEHIPLELF